MYTFAHVIYTHTHTHSYSHSHTHTICSKRHNNDRQFSEKSDVKSYSIVGTTPWMNLRNTIMYLSKSNVGQRFHRAQRRHNHHAHA
jgi:hypothetical protein